MYKPHVNNLISKRQQIWVLFSSYIKLSEVHTNFEFSNFFKHYNYRW